MLRNMCFTPRMSLLFWAALLSAQTPHRTPQMRPVIRGRHYAVTSMKPEATLVAERILRAGGNAFDAIVAGQAVLAQADAASNGVGSDAVILIYDARANKVISLNAEGTAPKLATIEWYKEHNKGELPDSDGLLAGTVPGVVDAWYTLLDRWGTMTFAQVLAPAIEIAEHGFPLSERLAAAINGSQKLKKYASSQKVYYPGGKVWKAGEIFTNPELARTLKRLVEAEQAADSKGRTPPCWPRGTASTRAISRAKWPASPRRTAACSATRISPPTTWNWKRPSRSITAATRSTRTLRLRRALRSYSP